MRIGCQIGIWKEGDLAEKIRGIGATGVQGVETFTTQLKPYHDDPGRFTSLLEEARLLLSGAYFNSKDFVDPAAEEAVVAEAAADCAFLAAVGGHFLVVNGGPWVGDEKRAFSDEEFAQLARVLNRIAEAAAEHGVGAVMHPHLKCMVETPADVDRLLAAGLSQERMGLCVHASHQLHIGADPYAIYEKHGAWVRYAHVGDADASNKGALLGEGVLDQKRLMQPLLDAGFDGWIIIECGKEGVSPHEYTRHATTYLTTTWPAVAWQI